MPSSSGWPCSARSSRSPAQPGTNRRPGRLTSTGGRWWTGCSSELAEARGGITLVVDDLHELTSPEALAQLTWLLTNLPPHVHAILAARHDLRLRLHQLRLADELADIRAADLRFTERETRELLDASGIMLSEAGVGAAVPADGRVGRGPAARGDLAGRSPRPGAVRRGVLRQRPHGHRVPADRDAGPPARRRPGSAVAHLPARPGQQRAGGRADRPPGLGTHLARAGGRERVRRLAGSRADVVPLPPPVRGSAAAGAAPDAARGSTRTAPARG